MEQRRFGDSDLVCSALVFGLLTGALTPETTFVDWKITEEDKAEIDRIFKEEGVPTYRGYRQAL